MCPRFSQQLRAICSNHLPFTSLTCAVSISRYHAPYSFGNKVSARAQSVMSSPGPLHPHRGNTPAQHNTPEQHGSTRPENVGNAQTATDTEFHDRQRMIGTMSTAVIFRRNRLDQARHNLTDLRRSLKEWQDKLSEAQREIAKVKLQIGEHEPNVDDMEKSNKEQLQKLRTMRPYKPVSVDDTTRQRYQRQNESLSQLCSQFEAMLLPSATGSHTSARTADGLPPGRRPRQGPICLPPYDP